MERTKRNPMACAASIAFQTRLSVVFFGVMCVASLLKAEPILLNPLPNGEYDLVRLGPLEAGAKIDLSSRANGINELGQVVGFAEDANGENNAFFWTPDNGMTKIGSYEADRRSTAQDVNDASVATGTSNVWVGPSDTRRAFAWSEESGMTLLGGPQQIAFAEDINNQGEVVGNMQEQFDSPWRVFYWNNVSGIQDIGTLGGAESRVGNINNNGQVVGSSQTESGAYRNFIWSSEHGLMDLGEETESRRPSRVVINDHGHVVGSKNSRSFLWTPDEGLEWVDAWEGMSVEVTAYSNSGQLIGFLEGNPVSWTQDGGFVELDAFVPGEFELLAVFDVNDLGQIVGYGARSVPEPETCFPLLVFAVGLSSCFRRRRVVAMKAGSQTSICF